MNSIEISVPFVVAIFGIAYPILFQVVTNLGEKYDSVLLVSIFKKEREYKTFKCILYIALGAIFVYILSSITRIINTHNFTEQIEILIIISTLFLIISFFLLVRKILIYYNRINLTKYFIHKDKDIHDFNNHMYFEAISELFYWSIKNQNEPLAKTISDYYYELFKKQREEKIFNERGYPQQYYDLTYKSTLELLRLDNNKLIYLESRIPGGTWLLGEFGENKIHEKTYQYLWINLKHSIEKNRDDIVMSFWNNASQYFSYSLKIINKQFSEDYRVIVNELDIIHRERERDRFLEFNHALGGLLLYQRRYNCIYRMFRFTQSEPPKYVLLPQSMGEIFYLFFRFLDGLRDGITWITYKYPFPSIEGIEADGVVRMWIRKYIAVLFLRQYTLVEYYVYQDHVNIPTIPKSQGERKYWYNYIDYFKEMVLDISSNKELMEALNFDSYGSFSDEWCRANNKITPEDLFNETKRELKEGIERAEEEQEPSKIKVQEFYDSSNKIVSSLFHNYEKIINKQEINEDYHSWYTIGIQSVIEKSSFVDDQGATHVNFDSFLANEYKNELNYSITQYYYQKLKKSYLLEADDLIKGIDNLRINNPEEYIIIAFDFYLNPFENVIGFDLDKYTYKGIGIHEIKGSFPLLRESLVIIKKVDLPYFNYRSIDEDIINKYELIEINADIKLYATVIDLNRRKDLWDEVRKIKDVDLRTQVILRIELATEFRWKNNIDVVQLQLRSVYNEKGIPNQLKDIEPIGS